MRKSKPVTKLVPVFSDDDEINLIGQICYLIDDQVKSGGLPELRDRHRVVWFINDKYGAKP